MRGCAGFDACALVVDPRVALCSHFHIDHAASVPYLTERTNFKGRMFATHPTKAVMKLLLSDYVRVRGCGDEALKLRQHWAPSLTRVQCVCFAEEWCWLQRGPPVHRSPAQRLHGQN